MNLALAATMKPEGEGDLDSDGFRTTDGRRDEVAQFCNKHGIPYSDMFVSIAVRDENVEPSSYLASYGDMELRLKSSVLAELKVACAGDFQTVACNGGAKPAGEQQDRYAERYRDLRGLDTEQKADALRQLVRSSSGTYVEVRLFRPIYRSDVATRTDYSLWGNLPVSSA